MRARWGACGWEPPVWYPITLYGTPSPIWYSISTTWFPTPYLVPHPPIWYSSLFDILIIRKNSSSSTWPQSLSPIGPRLAHSLLSTLSFFQFFHQKIPVSVTSIVGPKPLNTYFQFQSSRRRSLCLTRMGTVPSQRRSWGPWWDLWGRTRQRVNCRTWSTRSMPTVCGEN